MSLAEAGQGTICARFARFAQPCYIIYINNYIQPHVSCSPDTDAAQQAALQNACDDAEAICLKQINLDLVLTQCCCAQHHLEPYQLSIGSGDDQPAEF